MTWNEIRKTYPNKYILLKNYHETRDGDTLTILDGEVVLNGSDSKEIYHQYKARKDKKNHFWIYRLGKV